MEQEKIMRSLTIQSYHVTRVQFGESFALSQISSGSEAGSAAGLQADTTALPPAAASYSPAASASTFVSASKQDTANIWQLTIPQVWTPSIAPDPLIKEFHIRLISPENHHVPVPSIMDVIPVSVKALGKIGEGITKTLTGVYLLLTGEDEAGRPLCAFGNAGGMLDERMIFGRAGTPEPTDFLIAFDVILYKDAGISRPGPTAAHLACDLFANEIRRLLKNLPGRECSEKHVYQDVIRPGRKKVAVVKLISGQGAMYDTHFLGKEPSSSEESRSVIDITGAPLLLSPNEYRDGAIRAMY